MRHPDQDSYRDFCRPAILEKAVFTLIGIVEGITADSMVNASEIELLASWLELHRPYRLVHPFTEVVPLLEQILSDGVFDESERQDLLWLGRKILNGDLRETARSDMQVLHGILQGIVADGIIQPQELAEVQDWINRHTHLKTMWPYDEIESMIISVLADGIIDASEHSRLIAFLSDFCELLPAPLLGELNHAVTGICAVCPDIVFEGKSFCFTGASDRFNRKNFEALITRLGGTPKSSVSKNLDYLVIGGCGNPCWAFACYGRKVEAAMNLRKAGATIVIVHENDLQDAISDLRMQ